jgi:hypothetical protein
VGKSWYFVVFGYTIPDLLMIFVSRKSTRNGTFSVSGKFHKSKFEATEFLLI